ncbi:TIGR02281 family clan AA aspartic protease [Methyloligella sp. 2.7D]|uniref:retropepsin-like aspartic protease family protein n=1 Tax=unclassified Methyloligella TaxID=2625955 RepID=UPI00157D123C|nr:TIGR02281 family clan AA aspartic protease [Methyloligella sp. GL2]QKP77163.1 TIGR02281 family clan AA aspartic protease [Methyloligella sp. GL2]
MSTWLALFILALGGILLVANDSGTIASLDAETFGFVVFGAALLVYLGGGLLGSYGGRAGQMLRDIVTWAAIGLGLVTLYAYRGELMPIADRVASELIPGRGMVVEQSASGEAEVKLTRRLGGHFTAEADVDGKSITMIVDTGATTVVLTQGDAKAIGIDTKSLRYNIPVMTANGTTMAARVRIGEIKIGPLTRSDVSALVTRKGGGLSESLLGMSFLSRLRSYEFSGDYLTLRG